MIVDAMDPQVMVQVADQPGLREVADDAADKLQAAIDSLGADRRRDVRVRADRHSHADPNTIR